MHSWMPSAYACPPQRSHPVAMPAQVRRDRLLGAERGRLLSKMQYPAGVWTTLGISLTLLLLGLYTRGHTRRWGSGSKAHDIPEHRWGSGSKAHSIPNKSQIHLSQTSATDNGQGMFLPLVDLLKTNTSTLSWCNASTASRIAHEATTMTARGLPALKVFVYDPQWHARACTSDNLFDDANRSIFRRIENGTIHHSAKYMTALWSRIRSESGSITRTSDAASATLFATFCLRISHASRFWLPHLTPSNAHRHVIFLGKSGYWAPRCGNYADERKAPIMLFNNDRALNCNRFFDPTSLPYLSRRWTAHQPWKAPTRPRDVLVSYVGAAHGGAARLRRALRQACIDSFNCSYLDPSGKGMKESLEANVVSLFERSVFCLQPEGDTAYRKSIVDALLAGCIPVFFAPSTTLHMSLLWQAWKENAYVLFAPAANETIPALKQLWEHNLSRVRHMQQTIAHHAGTLQYGLDLDSNQQDASSLLFTRLNIVIRKMDHFCTTASPSD